MNDNNNRTTQYERRAIGGQERGTGKKKQRRLEEGGNRVINQLTCMKMPLESLLLCLNGDIYNIHREREKQTVSLF